MSMGALIEKFRTVGLDRIEQMNSLLVSLERSPDDSEDIDELMREIHTLKGEAKMMGFADINLVAHQTENLLLAIVDDGTLVDPEPIDLIFEGLDLMRALLTKSAGNSQQDLDLTGFVDRVAASGVESAKTAAAAAEDSETRESADADDTAPASPEPEDDSESTPAKSPDKNTSPPQQKSTTDVAEAPRSTSTRIESVGGESSSVKDSGSLRIQTSSSLRVDVEKLEKLGDIAGETLLMSRRLDYHLSELNEVRQKMRELMSQIDDNLPKSRSRDLLDLTHQLDACETALREENYLVNLRASQVDDQARNLRHVTLAQVLSHYPRAVRDLANSQGKQIRLTHTFGNVEVDRTILTALSEPLLHLVRNAVDHGIESPEERKEQGKDPEGEISLRAEYFGDSIRVELSDDGRGIDPDAVREKSIERQFLEPGKAERLSDQEAIALIFEPGFSTQAQVSDVSGRGMGMNVVRQQITKIGGFIEVESEVGQGTTFTLHLPVSSAVNAVLVFVISGQKFALTAKDVERVAMVDESQLKSVHGGICLRTEEGKLLPLVDWTTPLDLEGRGKPPSPMTVLLVRKGARRIAVWVDDVVGEREAISRPLGEFLRGVGLCRGIALTDSGAVVPLLNVVALLEQSSKAARLDLNEESEQEQPPRGRSFTAVQGQQAINVQTILVVEDSEVTRSLVVSILKNKDYRVIEADDGHHGWAMLQRHNVDLVLTDIQMPRMDGLELLEAIRDSDKYAHLPVVILTTLGAPEDKKKAMGLGANGYLVKLSFQEEELLETVERYIG